MTPMKAIREKCLECSGGSSNEVKLCTVIRCALYPFRLGKNPNIKKREYTEEQKAELASRLNNALKNRRSIDETHLG